MMPGSAMDMQYLYSPTNNSGQITQAVDSVSCEQTTHQYDALKRLSSAVATTTGSSPAPLWGQTFSYDGFGNLTDMTPTTGAAPALRQTVNSATNQVTGSSTAYDADGNMTAMDRVPRFQ